MKNIFRGIKIIDFLALFIFLGIMAVAYLFMMRKAEYVDVVLRVSQSDLININTGGISATLPAWYLENLKEDKIALLDKSSMSIVKVYEYQNNSNEKIVYLTLRLLVTFDKNNGNYTYQGLPLLVGSYQNFRYKGIMLRGIIQEVGNYKEKREEKYLMVEGEVKVDNFLTSKIVKGLTISDSDDQVMVKIEEVKVGPDYVKAIDNGRLMKVEDKDKKVISLKLKVKVKKFDNVYLYGGETAIKIGSDLVLDFWNFDIKVTVTNIQESLQE